MADELKSLIVAAIPKGTVVRMPNGKGHITRTIAKVHNSTPKVGRIVWDFTDGATSEPLRAMERVEYVSLP